MKAKVATIILGIFFLQLISSCCKHVKYFDFSEMTVQLSNNIIEQNDTLTIELSATDLEYLSDNFSDFSFNAALALSCDDGWGGMKYPFQNIQITSDVDFKEGFLADENLASLFQVRKFLGNGEFEFMKIEESNLKDISYGDVRLWLLEKPTIALNHQFKIKLTKSNEEEITVETEEIIWQ